MNSWYIDVNCAYVHSWICILHSCGLMIVCYTCNTYAILSMNNDGLCIQEK
jgi:hypothetical protein